MEIRELLEEGVEIIKSRKYGNPILEASLVLEKLLDVDRVYLHTHSRDPVDENIRKNFLEIMEKRSKGHPIQYLLNSWEFMGLDFYIEEGVLIPRPDTEILVEYVVEYIDENFAEKNINFLDLGIGSGAICLSVAHYKKNVNAYGVDIHEKPLEITRINKKRLKLDNVELYKGDLFSALDGLGLEKSFHIIASNPPYIAKSEIAELQEEVRDYEPMEALDGGTDGLSFYRSIIPESKKYLRPGAMLIFEIGFDQGAEVVELMEEHGFKDIEILKDLQGLNRVVKGILPRGRQIL